MTINELAQAIGATVHGDGAGQVSGCAGLEDAGPEHLSFLANPKYARLMKKTKAGAVVVGPQHLARAAGHTLLVADDPYFAFRQAVVALHGFRKQPPPGVSKLASVDPTATLGADCCVQPLAFVAEGAVLGARCVIYPHCYIGPHTVLGDDCILYPGVTVYDRCVIGHRVILHAGTVIGEDGFGHATHGGAHHKIPQVGNVVIEDDVELGACCTIDRATVGSTRIGKGTKTSDLIAIGHGTVVGKHNLLVAHVGIAGSAETGDYVAIGGQSGVAGHLRVGNLAQIAARSGVVTDVPDKAQYGGSPAIPLDQAKIVGMEVIRLPELVKELRALQRRVAELEGGK